MITDIKRSKDNYNLNYFFFDVVLKDLRTLQFKVFDPYKTNHKKLTDLLRDCNTFNELYAFKFFKKTDLESKYGGWDIFDIQKEYYRQGLDFEVEEKMEFRDLISRKIRWRLVKNLKNSYEVLCDSYPEYLMIPSNINPIHLQIAIKFRSRNRFPVMTYYWMNPELPKQYATLWRSAQCNVSIDDSGWSGKQQVDRRRVLHLFAQ